MIALLSVLLVVGALQSSRGAESRPVRLPFGYWTEIELSGTPAEATLSFEVAIAEPLVIAVNAYDFDVEASVEDSSGATLARDDDSGIETNVWIEWTPPRAGSYRLRARGKGASTGLGLALLLRGPVRGDAGDPRIGARAYWERAWYRATQQRDAPRASAAIARIAEIDGDSDAARCEASLRALTESLREVSALVGRSAEALRGGDHAGARERVREANVKLSAIPAVRESAMAADTAWEIGRAAARCNERRVSRDGFAAARAFYERAESAETPRFVDTLANEAMIRDELGELREARAMKERVLEVRERTHPPEHPQILVAWQNLAGTLHSLGEMAAALRLYEAVLEVRARRFGANDRMTVTAQQNVAALLLETGELSRSRTLCESVLAARERTFSPNSPGVLVARKNLAGVLMKLGDAAGARAHFERVLAAEEEILAPDDPALLRTRSNLALVLLATGDAAAARALQEQLVAVFDRTLPEDHPDRQSARGNLALSLLESGETAAARELLERITEELAAARGDSDLETQGFRRTLAIALVRSGDLESAQRQLARVDAALEAEGDDPGARRIETWVKLLEVRTQCGERSSLAPLAVSIARASVRWLAELRGVSPREASEVAHSTALDVAAVVSASRKIGPSPELDDALFEWLERRRSVATGVRRPVSAAEDASVAALRGAVTEARRRAASLVAGIEEDGAASRPSPRALSEAALARDRAERELARAIAEREPAAADLSAAGVSRALRSDEAFAGFVRIDASGGEMIVHVLRAGGRPRRIELGPASRIAEAAARWREIVGAPVARGAGEVAPDRRQAEREAGEALRALVLDPVLREIGGATRLTVCLDDVLHLVPLDALPLEERAVGDRIAVRVEPSLAHRFAPPRASSSAPSLLAFGGIDFDAVPGRPASAPARGGPGGLAFIPLDETRAEAEGIASIFTKVFGEGAVTRLGEAATKEAFLAGARRARYVHLATHGYFAPESVRSTADAPASRPARAYTLEDAAMGLAPMTLCGLALAGANRGADALGRVPGILTAEELASADLGGCELAVLSACETSVGIRRAGLGIASLQAALHAAGARAAVTSLWRVGDVPARELMVDFYRRLWIEKKPAARALWESKKAARAKGLAPRDWAGWILTGDPGEE